MAELSVEEITRLARNFLVGKGGPGELEDLKRNMASDPQLPLELLQQMQTALDEVPPAGFTPDQWKEIDARVASLVNPMLRSGLGRMGRFFAGLFKKKRPEGSGRLKRRGEAPEPEAPPLVERSAEELIPAVADEGLEEMAPIAAPPPPPLAAAAAAEAPEPEPQAPSPRNPNRTLALVVLGFLLAGALFYYTFLHMLLWLSRRAAAKAAAAKPAAAAALQPTPAALRPLATAVPAGNAGPARPQRSQPSVDKYDALPSELPPQTPQAAGSIQPISGLEDKGQDGQRGFPLP